MKFNWWSMILVGILLAIVGGYINGLIGDSLAFLGGVMILVGLLSGYRVYKENKLLKTKK